MYRVVILGFLLAWVACSTEEVDIPLNNNSAPYFPMYIGLTNTYQIDEVIFLNEGLVRDMLSYQLQERVVDEFIDDTGQQVYVIDRFKRNSEQDAWIYDLSWQAFIGNNQAVRIENNRKFIKMQFPLTEGLEWNGNAFFDASAPVLVGNEHIDYYKYWKSRIDRMNYTEVIGTTSYDQVIAITLADEENRLELRKGMEKYAEGIGLVYKELQILDTQCFQECQHIPWIDKAEKGHIFIQKMIN